MACCSAHDESPASRCVHYGAESQFTEYGDRTPTTTTNDSTTNEGTTVETGDVSRRLKIAMETARAQAADRRARDDAGARRPTTTFLEKVAGPVVKQLANALKVEGMAFTLFTPAGGLRLASDRNRDDFIELALERGDARTFRWWATSATRGARAPSPRPCPSRTGPARRPSPKRTCWRSCCERCAPGWSAEARAILGYGISPRHRRRGTAADPEEPHVPASTPEARHTSTRET